MQDPALVAIWTVLCVQDGFTSAQVPVEWLSKIFWTFSWSQILFCLRFHSLFHHCILHYMSTKPFGLIFISDAPMSWNHLHCDLLSATLLFSFRKEFWNLIFLPKHTHHSLRCFSSLGLLLFADLCLICLCISLWFILIVHLRVMVVFMVEIKRCTSILRKVQSLDGILVKQVFSTKITTRRSPSHVT